MEKELQVYLQGACVHCNCQFVCTSSGKSYGKVTGKHISMLLESTSRYDSVACHSLYTNESGKPATSTSSEQKKSVKKTNLQPNSARASNPMHLGYLGILI